MKILSQPLPVGVEYKVFIEASRPREHPKFRFQTSTDQPNAGKIDLFDLLCEV